MLETMARIAPSHPIEAKARIAPPLSAAAQRQATKCCWSPGKFFWCRFKIRNSPLLVAFNLCALAVLETWKHTTTTTTTITESHSFTLGVGAISDESPL
jgi:hypothetical protein